MRHIPDALAPLAAYRQWVLWIAVPSKTRPGKVDKFPVDVTTGEVKNAHDPSMWTDAQTAINTAAQWGDGFGVGFVFTEADPFYFLDIDNCTEGGQWSALAVELCGRMAGAAVEVSQSGQGLHIIGSGRAPDHRCKNTALKLEFYTSGRFVALTGTHAAGSAAFDCSHTLPALVADYFAPREEQAPEAWTEAPAPEWNGPTDDEQLLAKALGAGNAASAFGQGVTFRDLWERNVAALAAKWPDDAREYDASSADAALAQHLAFWTGKDCARMQRLMQRSALVRDKWNREDYLPRTIVRAVSLQGPVYTAGGTRNSEPAPTPVEPGPTMQTGMGAELREGFQFLAATQQSEFFRGCVYVRDVHRVFTPDGAFLGPQQFKAVYGGYVFALDAMNDKTTRNAWEAFTESQAVRFPKVAGTIFRPELEPGTVIEEEGHALVNTFIPIDTHSIDGDVSPFLGLLARLLPNERDRQILLTYLAALVQHQGRKFQWWPVLQGAEGNGKTLIVSALAHAIGHRYTFLPNTEDIAKSGNKFNGWIRNRLFVGLEEVYVAERRDFLNAFKTTVTNERLATESKGVDQIMTDNRANGIMCTNFRAGVPVTVDQRRYAVFFTAQQSAADLVRDGMTSDYFPNLYDWAKGRGAWAHMGAGYGFAVINHFLRHMPLAEEFNPAGMCQRAPATSSTGQAVDESRGGIEQEILEAVDEGRPGFAGGWVSSMALDRLIESLRATRAISPNKRRELMQSLGYDWHPGLRNGRVHAPVQPDGGKPKLFIKTGHPCAGLNTPSDIARYYSDAQAGELAQAVGFGK